MRWPIGPEAELVYAPSTHAAAVVPPTVARVLVECHRFQPLDCHATAWLQARGADERDAPRLTRLLAQLAGAGLLDCREHLVAR
jgi:hypothetical protein